MAVTRPVGRPRRGGLGRRAKQYKLQPVTVAKKLAILARLDESDIRSTITHFFPALDPAFYQSRRTQILRWRRNRKQLEAAAASGKREHAKLRQIGLGTILSNDSESELVVWVNELRSEGIPVSAQMLSMKAREVAAEAGVVDFMASDKWVVGFKRRHHFSLRTPTRQAQISPADIQAVANAFAADVQAVMLNLGISRVYNADQTAVFFEYVAKKTLCKRGAKTVWVKCSGASKERATVMLLGDSNGYRCTPFVVFKVKPSRKPEIQIQNNKIRHGFGKRIWKRMSPVQDSETLRIYGNSKGWWNEELSVEFLRFHFACRPFPQEPILLLWDDFSGHWTDKVVHFASSINVTLMKVPPHATAVSQPADVAWNFPFKANLRKLWQCNMQDQLKRPRPANKKFVLERPDREQICGWIRQSWNGLAVDTIANGFKASGLLPDPHSAASSDLVAQLEELSLLEGLAVDEDRDFAFEATV